MKRRDFLRATGVFSASLAFAKPGRIFTNDSTHDFTNDQWRTFEVTTRAEVLKPSGGTRIWLPAPLISKSPFQKTLPKALSAEKVKGRNQVQAPSSPIPEPSEQAVAVIARDPSPCTPPDSSSDIELRLPGPRTIPSWFVENDLIGVQIVNHIVYLALAASLLESSGSRFEHRTSVANAKRLVYLKLMENYQNTDPFKFIIYSGKIGEQTPQLASGK
jgi:hypothetical protein